MIPLVYRVVGGVVIRTSLVLALSGIAAGIVLAAMVSPRGLLTLVAIVTSLTPAIRASRVNPLEVLRSDF